MLPMSQKIWIEAVSDPGLDLSYNNLNPLFNVSFCIEIQYYIINI